jgi:branched-chain amino acid transport system permease protein
LSLFLQSLISGILVGGAYALIGIGLTLIFGVMRVTNFAHGELLMVGMYLTYFAFKLAGIDPFVSVLLVIPTMFVLGAVLQRTLIQRLLGTLPQNQILLTIGLGLVLSNTSMLLFTSDYRIISTPYSSASVRLGTVSISQPLLISFLVTAALSAALYWFLSRTFTGRAIRATAQDRDAAQLMGVDVQRMGVIAFGIGAALAGTAGTLISPTYYIFPQVGGAFTLKAFVIVVLGGMGSVAGATLGGIIIGVVESLAAVYASASVKEIFVYVLFLAVLLVKPSGLLGKSRV